MNSNGKSRNAHPRRQTNRHGKRSDVEKMDKSEDEKER